MDLNTLLAETSPSTEPPPPEVLTAARTRLDDAVTAAGRTVSAVRVAKLRRRRRRLVIASIAAAAATAIVLVPVLGTGTGSAPSAAAAEVMLAAADAAGEQGDGWPDAAYWHVTREFDYVSEGSEPFIQEVWWANDGNTIIVSDDPAWPSGPDGPLYQEGEPTRFSAGSDLDWDGLYALPTDPGELEALLRSGLNGTGPDDDTELWETVTGLLSGSPASPALRRALWQVAATIPGVELIGRTTDSLGRPGYAIERDMTDIGWSRVRYILDSDDGALLEVLTYTPDGEVDYRMTIVDQGPVDTAPTPDPPFCGPGSEPYKSC